ncbi:sporulation protein YpjB [Paenibacillus sp.]|jgi:sporulation protein YpjB|uniref:sporulation protein YpjB n=1 Tax=Paenibacillus sp. TaxID=58172 RepID=UPI00282CC3EC|nr:sporulation protein YpjB [Paenibacillus sp.]MDR0271579.1 sporulation protein YpjB [Paenibacillus sp.]
MLRKVSLHLKRDIRICLLFFVVFLTAQVGGVHALADHVNTSGTSVEDATKQAQSLSQAVERMYHYVLAGNLNAVNQDLQEVNSIFENSSLQKLTTVEGIHALSESIIEMKAAVARVKIDPDQWLTASAKLRMAADSLSNPKQPMWLQYYKLIREELSRMKSGVDKGEFLAAKEAYDRLQNHYEIIRPAIVIQRKQAEVTMADSWLSYAGGLVNAVQPKPAEIQSMIEQGEEMFNVLFGKKKDYPAFAPFNQVNNSWPWLLWGGAFIVVILAYTAYRKYKGERDSIKSMTPKW